MPLKRIKLIELPEPPQVKIPTSAVLWSLYISGRWGPEKHLGFVIADAKSMDWAKSSSVLAMDIVGR